MISFIVDTFKGYLKNKTLHYTIAGIISTIFFVKLTANINHFSIPNSDIFQYIAEGKVYLSLRWPDHIHPPPGWPILITIFSKLLFTSQFPEILSAHILNFIFSSVSIFIIFHLIYKYSHLTAFVTIILLTTNKIYFINSLDVTNEISYLFLITLALLFYQQQKYKTAYALSGVAFLFRYEAIILLLSIFIIDYLTSTKKFNYKKLVIPILIIGFWLTVLNTYNHDSISNNTYISEIKASIDQIPNTSPYKQMIDIITFNSINALYFSLVGPIKFNEFPSYIIGLLFPIIIYILYKLNYLQEKPQFVRISYLFFILHTSFLCFFPNYAARYQIPIIWILYLLLINRSNKLFRIIMISALMIYNLIQINQISLYDRPQEKAEYALAYQWINQQKFNHPSRIFIYDPGIIKYFHQNSNSIIDLSSSYYDINDDDTNLYKKCLDNIECVIQKTKQNNEDIIVISTNTSSQPLDKIFDKNTSINYHHLPAFQDSNFIHNNKFKLLKAIDDPNYQNVWIKIYRYIP